MRRECNNEIILFVVGLSVSLTVLSWQTFLKLSRKLQKTRLKTVCEKLIYLVSNRIKCASCDEVLRKDKNFSLLNE